MHIYVTTLQMRLTVVQINYIRISNWIFFFLNIKSEYLQYFVGCECREYYF